MNFIFLSDPGRDKILTLRHTFRNTPLADSYGATIISDLKSTCNVPPCNISKMDGYAVIGW